MWFVCSGMGTQWVGMCRRMMDLPLFHNSIMKADAILRSVGFNLYDVLMSADEQTFEDPVNSFTGITSTQVSICMFRLVYRSLVKSQWNYLLK